MRPALTRRRSKDDGKLKQMNSAAEKTPAAKELKAEDKAKDR